LFSSRLQGSNHDSEKSRLSVEFDPQKGGVKTSVSSAKIHAEAVSIFISLIKNNFSLSLNTRLKNASAYMPFF
jgi:hypothetical protein